MEALELIHIIYIVPSLIFQNSTGFSFLKIKYKFTQNLKSGTTQLQIFNKNKFIKNDNGTEFL